MRDFGPCLCGDPECPRCFPGGYDDEGYEESLWHPQHLTIDEQEQLWQIALEEADDEHERG